MAHQGRPCAVCAHPSVDLIDGLLMSGANVNEIHRERAEALNLPSLSSLFRHSRAHLGPLAPRLISADVTTGDLVADLANLRSNLMSIHERAFNRGDHTAATRAAHEAVSISSTLLKEIGMNETWLADELKAAGAIVDGVRRAAQNRPAWARELAAAFRQISDPVNADAVDRMAEYHESTTKKEN